MCAYFSLQRTASVLLVGLCSVLTVLAQNESIRPLNRSRAEVIQFFQQEMQCTFRAEVETKDSLPAYEGRSEFVSSLRLRLVGEEESLQRVSMRVEISEEERRRDPKAILGVLPLFMTYFYEDASLMDWLESALRQGISQAITHNMPYEDHALREGYQFKVKVKRVQDKAAVELSVSRK